MDRFSLSPFDERYLKVPYEYMEYLYIRFMSTHSFEELRKVYVKALAEKEENEKYDEELAEQMEKYGGGFNPVQIEEVMKAFKEAK